MSFTKVIAVFFNFLGALFCLLAVIAGGMSVTALLERMRHGRGIMFADVEFFVLTALALLVLGLVLLVAARQLTKRISGPSSGSKV